MQASNFATAKNDPHAVAICRGIPEDFKGRHYMALAPTAQSLKAVHQGKISPAQFKGHYTIEILEKLDPMAVFNHLGPDAILLCWEPFNKSCHRRIVAEWLEAKLGIIVPELNRRRDESLPYDAQKLPYVKKADRK